MKLIRRHRKSAIVPARDMTPEGMVEYIADLMGTIPQGRNQKIKKQRFDLLLPGGEPGEVKFSNGHPYRHDGFRHSVSNLFGLGDDENDGEYFIIAGRRRIPHPELTWPDNTFFFLFFSRSQLKKICSRTGMLSLPVNWEPGGDPPKNRSDALEKNAAIVRAVVYAKSLEHVESLVAANTNNPAVTARPKMRKTMTRTERIEQALTGRISELEIQLANTVALLFSVLAEVFRRHLLSRPPVRAGRRYFGARSLGEASLNKG
ncbi:hypothetical protein [Comamonas thiooxydans]|uniref:hypothetical protein n=1 Tax=Comamonas thiooxydans TaxID=363952 RepID=UPI0013DB35B9|nr:hypothetical protein [Comamonas thiooxydans]